MKDYKTINELDAHIKNMSDEDFNNFCENFNEEQVKIMQGARFFNKIFNNPTLMKKLQNTMGEVVYEELTKEI